MAENKEQYQHILQTLKSVDFFSKLKMGELESIMARLHKLSCSKGHVVIREGDPGDAFYMIYSGRVAVWKKKGFFGKKLLAYLEDGKYFGEMALVTSEPRNATIIAEDACEFFVLYTHDFKDILMANPSIRNSIEEVVRMRQATNIVKLKE